MEYRIDFNVLVLFRKKFDEIMRKVLLIFEFEDIYIGVGLL